MAVPADRGIHGVLAGATGGPVEGWTPIPSNSDEQKVDVNIRIAPFD